MKKLWLGHLKPSELRRQFDLLSVRITLLFTILFVAAAVYVNGAVLLYSQAELHQIRQVDSVALLARAADQLSLYVATSTSPDEGVARYASRLVTSLPGEDVAVYNQSGELIHASLGSRLPNRLVPNDDTSTPVEELAAEEPLWDVGYSAQPLTDEFELLFGPLLFADEVVGWQAICYDLSTEQRLNQNVFLRSASGLLLILALILSSGVYLRSFTRRNIAPLISATQRIARSQWQEPLNAELTGEFAQIGHSIEAMRQGLQEYERQRQLVLARISHDVLGPLKTISTIASLNQPDEAEHVAFSGGKPAFVANGHASPLQDDWEVVAVCSDHVNRLLEDIKYLVGGGRVDYLASQSASPLALLPVLTQILAYYRTKTGTRVRFSLKEPAAGSAANAPFCVCIDRTRLTQVVGNLIDNALSHGQATSITLSLRREAVGEQDFIWLGVQDNGIGIPAAVRPRIFEERFSTSGINGDGNRGANGWTASHFHQRGSHQHESHHGLGLAIVADIIRASGGAIDVDGAPQGGTTFTLRLPACREASGDQSDVEPCSAAGGAAVAEVVHNGADSAGEAVTHAV